MEHGLVLIHTLLSRWCAMTAYNFSNENRDNNGKVECGNEEKTQILSCERCRAVAGLRGIACITCCFGD